MNKELKLAAKLGDDFLISALNAYIKSQPGGNRLALKSLIQGDIPSVFEDLRESQVGDFSLSVTEYEQYISYCSKFNISFYVDNKLVFVGGALAVRPALCETWLVVGNSLQDIGSRTLYLLMRVLKMYHLSLPYTRIQATVKNNFTQGHRFVKFFGYKKEGVLRKYGADGEDYTMYSIIPGEDV